MKDTRRFVFRVVFVGTVWMRGSAMAADKLWVGNTDTNWSTGANWSPVGAPVANDALFFGAAGGSGVHLYNDLAAATEFSGLTFGDAAGAFVIGGNGMTLGGNIAVGTGVASVVVNADVVLSAGRTITVDGGALTLGGAIVGPGFGLTKAGAGMLALRGANGDEGTLELCGGTVEVDAGAGGALHTNSALTFGETATFRYGNTTAAGVRALSLGALTSTAGEGTVELARTAPHAARLSFASRAPARYTTVNYAISGAPGTNGTDAAISFTARPATARRLDQYTFFNGASFAAYDTNGYVRELNYAADANAIGITNSVASFASAGAVGKDVDLGISGCVTGATTEKIASLRLGATNMVTIADGHTLRCNKDGGVNTGAILKTGGGVAVIRGGTGLEGTWGGSGDFVIRCDHPDDVLRIETPLLDWSSTALTKSGLGVLTLSGATGTWGGPTTVNAGTLLVNGAHVSTSIWGPYHIRRSGVLGGSGRIRIAGPLTVHAGGMIAPGDGPGTSLKLDGGALGEPYVTMEEGAAFRFTLDAGGGAPTSVDFWNYASGDLALNDNAVDLALAGTPVTGTYTGRMFRFYADAGLTPASHGIAGGLKVGAVDANIHGAPTIVYGVQSIDVVYTVSGLTAKSLAFTTAPAVATAGVVSAMITVQRQDERGMPVTSDPDLVVGLSSDSSGTMVFDPAFVRIPLGESVARFTYTDTRAGAATLRAHAAFVADATQRVVIVPAAAIALAATAGDRQFGTPETALPGPLVVAALDAYANGVPGVSVDFVFVTTPVGATGQALSVTNTVTSEDGHASSIPTLGDGLGAYTVSAAAAGLTGSPVLFMATAVPPWDAVTLHYDADTNAAGPQDGAGAGWNRTNRNFWTDTTDIAWPNTTNNVAVFGAGSGAAATVHVDSVIASGIVFEPPREGAYTLAGGTIALAGTSPSVVARHDATIASALAGANGFTKTGGGTLTLSGANTLSGTGRILDGLLLLESPDAWMPAGGFVIGSNAVMEFRSATRNYTPERSAVLSGRGTLVKSGGGRFDAGNDHAQLTFAMDGGRMEVLAGTFAATAGDAAATPDWSANKAVLHIAAGATVTMPALSVAPNALTVGALTGAGTLDADGWVPVLTLGAGGGSGSFSGALLNSGQDLVVIKVGTGTQTLVGASAHRGDTTVSGGTLLVDGMHEAAEGTFSVGHGATLGGSGTVARPVIVYGGGTLAPGGASATGRFTVSNHVTMETNSVLDVDIRGPTAGAAMLGHDQLRVLGGNAFAFGQDAVALAVHVRRGTEMRHGQLYTIVSGPISGTRFRNLPDGAVFTADGYAFAIDYGPASITLTALTTFLPNTGLLMSVR